MLSILDIKRFLVSNVHKIPYFISSMIIPDLAMALSRLKHQLGRNSKICSGLWPRQMFWFLFQQSSSRNRAFSSSGMMGKIVFSFGTNNIHTQNLKKENMINSHRFSAYGLVYLFSAGFWDTSLFTNETMFFVTYAVSPLSILEKLDKNPSEMWVWLILSKKNKKSRNRA